MKQVLLFTIFLISGLCGVKAQETSITLEECQEKAKKNYPLINQYQLLDIAENYTLDNISKIYLPKVSFNAQASYQSDVTKLTLKKELPIALDISEYMPTMKKDQYRAYAEVQQLIWDGNQSKAQAALVKANNSLDKQKVAVSLYAVRGKVNDLYFAVLALEEQKKELVIYREDLQANADLVRSMLKNGVAMESDLDRINVEFLNIDQKNIELDATKDAYVHMLSVFIGDRLSSQAILEKPSDIWQQTADIRRPELAMFERQRSLLSAQRGAIKAKNMPGIGLFAQGGYGRPALNMLDPDFKFYGIAGAKFTWNFGNLYTRKNELGEINNNLKMVDVQQEAFLFNTKIELEHISPEINKYRDLMGKDDGIVDLRTRVKNTSQSKYKNGVYQMSDLITDTNAESLARQAKAQHYIQYLKSIYQYKFTRGN